MSCPVSRADTCDTGRRAVAADWLRDERGAEQMSYLLILAAVVLPLFVAVRMLWAILVYYFTIGTFMIDMPLF